MSLSLPVAFAESAAAVEIYGAWHCSDDYCMWGSARDMTEFDQANHWLIDRGDGSRLPSVNLVILSFVNPLKLLHKTTDAQTSLGIPIGMTQNVVQYFTSRGIRVMLSIGGITYVNAWNQALAADPRQLGLNAAEAARRLGVGIEIDYEEDRNPDLAGLESFIAAYRSALPYDWLGTNPAARLTIDLAAGDRWLIDLTRKASRDWLNTSTPVLDYANAMIPETQPGAAEAAANWQEHIDGKPQYSPPIPPLAPAKLTGSLWLVGSRSIAECTNFGSSVQKAAGEYVETVAPNGAGITPGMLGYMFWAAECEGTREVCTTRRNTCEGGVGAGANHFNISIPMLPLRQQ